MKWFRMYAEIVDDPKVQTLRPELFKFWVTLLALACKEDRCGALPTPQEIAYSLRMRIDRVTRFISDLQALKLLYNDSKGSLKPYNWDVRQPLSDHGADRVKRFRERASKNRQVSDVTLHETLHVTPSDKCVELDLELDKEKEKELSLKREQEKEKEVKVSAVNPVQRPSTPQRSAEDQADFDAACEMLVSDLRTEWLGIELSRRSTLPEVLGWAGWRFRYAAKIIMSAKCTDGHRRDLPYFMGIVKKADQYHTSLNGNGQPPLTPFQQREKRQRETLLNIDLSKLPEM